MYAFTQMSLSLKTATRHPSCQMGRCGLLPVEELHPPTPTTRTPFTPNLGALWTHLESLKTYHCPCPPPRWWLVRGCGLGVGLFWAPRWVKGLVKFEHHCSTLANFQASFKAMVLKLESVSQCPGGLIKTDSCTPSPELLVAQARDGP